MISSENFEVFTLNIIFSDLKKNIAFQDIEQVNRLVNSRDSINIQAIFDGSDPAPLINEENVNEVNTIINSDEASNFSLRINIKKDITTHEISIYCFKNFVEFLLEKNLYQLLNVLSKYLKINQLNKLEIVTGEEEQTIFMSNILTVYSGSPKEVSKKRIEKRKTIIDNRNLYSNSQNLSRYNFLPSDFKNETMEEVKSESEDMLVSLFEKLRIVLSISFLANISAIEEKTDKFTFSLNNTRYLNFESSFDDVDVENAKSLFEIYLWVFEEGFLYDKLAISREIIMNYFKREKNTWYLEPDTIFIIYSAHNLYLKENVERYLELKNRMAEFSLELSVKTKELATDFTKALRNNHLTLVTFFISLFVFNALSGNQFTDIFTRDISVISYGLITISFIYLIITILQMIQDLIRHKERFYNIKQIYKDTMTETELTTIFKNEIILNDIRYIKKSMIIYSFMWMVELIVLLSIVFLLSANIDFSLWKDRIVTIVTWWKAIKTLM